ncbi:MAG: hypothetical protein RDV48_01610 [Candidatus Eremiobacteraeota bacterium]|nr:hypothetical protein [Candidatus Eremiobacteraeota bacterium]
MRLTRVVMIACMAIILCIAVAALIFNQRHHEKPAETEFPALAAAREITMWEYECHCRRISKMLCSVERESLLLKISLHLQDDPERESHEKRILRELYGGDDFTQVLSPEECPRCCSRDTFGERDELFNSYQYCRKCGEVTIFQGL